MTVRIDTVARVTSDTESILSAGVFVFEDSEDISTLWESMW